MEPPPFKWGDRYDLAGLVVGAVLGGALLLLSVPVLTAIPFGTGATALAAYALRRRAGIPQVTLWQRWRMGRHAPR